MANPPPKPFGVSGIFPATSIQIKKYWATDEEVRDFAILLCELCSVPPRRAVLSRFVLLWCADTRSTEHHSSTNYKAHVIAPVFLRVFSDRKTRASFP